MMICCKIINMINRLLDQYESCKTPIRVAFFGFVCIAFGSFIKNPNVNIFYTFKSNIILFIAELFLNIGKIVINNLPIIFMLNIVCKKEHNAAPVVLALVGYFTYLVTTMLVANQNLGAQAYANGYGLNSVFNITGSSRLPLETGLIGSFLVAYATRLSFIISRHRSNYNLSNIFTKDTAGIVYNVLICFALGLAMSYAYPFVYQFIQRGITFIANDILDPARIALYTVLDRLLSILGLGNIIRYPFWFTSLGGSYQNTLTGQSVLGDVNIWPFIKENVVDYYGSGRFITPYYVVNMFIIPAFYLGTLTCISDTKEKNSLLLTFIAGMLLSIIYGNPLPIELLMLFTSPILLVFYFVLLAAVSFSLVELNAFLGFECGVDSIITAMPGSFPDLIINLRNINFSNTLLYIAIVGLIAFGLMFLGTIVYYKYIAFDFSHTGSGDKLIEDIIESVGGEENVISASAGLFKLNIMLKTPELIYIEKMRKIGPRRISEDREGVNFEFGTQSYAIAKAINERIN